MDTQQRQTKMLEFLQNALHHEKKPVNCTFGTATGEGFSDLWDISFSRANEPVQVVNRLNGQKQAFLNISDLCNWAASKEFNQLSQAF